MQKILGATTRSQLYNYCVVKKSNFGLHNVMQNMSFTFAG